MCKARWGECVRFPLHAIRFSLGRPLSQSNGKLASWLASKTSLFNHSELTLNCRFYERIYPERSSMSGDRVGHSTWNMWRICLQPYLDVSFSQWNRTDLSKSNGVNRMQALNWLVRSEFNKCRARDHPHRSREIYVATQGEGRRIIHIRAFKQVDQLRRFSRGWETEMCLKANR